MKKWRQKLFVVFGLTFLLVSAARCWRLRTGVPYHAPVLVMKRACCKIHELNEKYAFPLGGRWPEGPDEGATPGNFRPIAPSSVAARQLPPKANRGMPLRAGVSGWYNAHG